MQILAKSGRLFGSLSQQIVISFAIIAGVFYNFKYLLYMQNNNSIYKSTNF